MRWSKCSTHVVPNKSSQQKGSTEAMAMSMRRLLITLVSILIGLAIMLYSCGCAGPNGQNVCKSDSCRQTVRLDQRLDPGNLDGYDVETYTLQVLEKPYQNRFSGKEIPFLVEMRYQYDGRSYTVTMLPVRHQDGSFSGRVPRYTEEVEFIVRRDMKERACSNLAYESYCGPVRLSHSDGQAKELEERRVIMEAQMSSAVETEQEVRFSPELEKQLGAEEVAKLKAEMSGERFPDECDGRGTMLHTLSSVRKPLWSPVVCKYRAADSWQLQNP